MCISIPYRIKEIKGKQAVVLSPGNKENNVGLDLVENLKVGDWILSLNNFAVQKITASEAREIIKLYKL